MNLGQLTELPVIECVPFRKGKPGFALPLLAHPERNDLRLVQEIDEYRNVVSGFRLLEDYTPADAIPINGPLAAIGKEFVHVFVTEIGLLHAGNLGEISSFLEEFAGGHPDEHAVILQIRELVGTDQEKKIARLIMRRDIGRDAGANAAAAFYEGDILRTALWSRILKTAPDEDSARRILRVRPQLSAHIQQDGGVKLDLSALDIRDYSRINQDTLRAELLAEFRPPSDDTTILTLHGDIKPENVLQAGKVSELISRTSGTRRQEERVAILIDAILRDRKTGMSALVQYKTDKAKYATWALRELRSSLLFNQNRSVPTDEEVIANLIPRFFTKAFPLSRGDLLYHLARHLAKWPKVNTAIRHSLNKTHSMFVNAYRKQIEELLDKPRWD